TTRPEFQAVDSCAPEVARPSQGEDPGKLGEAHFLSGQDGGESGGYERIYCECPGPRRHMQLPRSFSSEHSRRNCSHDRVESRPWGGEGQGIDSSMREDWLVIADDLTGACDSAVHFSAEGRRTMAIVAGDQAAGDAQVLALTTESRDVEPAEAVRR